MTTTVDQKAYLQKYLSGSTSDKKKKKKKVVKGKGFKIIDDDIDLTKLRPLDVDELDILGEGEDAPQIAGIIDERPEEIKKLEQFKTSSKWRVVNQDDGFNSKLQIEEIKRDIKEVEKENELVFGKMYSDSEDEKQNDSDLSPPRKHVNEKSKNIPKKPQNNSDRDFSPPRKKREASPKQSKNDSDVSPPRRHDHPKPKLKKPSRWGEYDNSYLKRKQADEEKQRNPSRKSRRNSSDSDISPPRKKERSKNYDSDLSPPRKNRIDPPNSRNRSHNSDLPPQQKKTFHNEQSNNYKNKMDREMEKTKKVKKSNSDHSDLSPPRKRRQMSPSYRRDSDSDLSPPRKGQKRGKEMHRRNSDSPPPSNKKMAKTLEGKVAGLQEATQLRQENEAFRRKEDEAFSKMTDEVSGRNAKAVSRKGKRVTSEERQKEKEKAEKQKELDEKYKKWSKGLKQLEAQEARTQDYLHEASKPLARHKDDRDLEGRLRDVEREGDPMLRYIKEKKRERGELPPEKPTYKGNFPLNRFNIRPGYRWDGVDRSNGYENKYFQQQSRKKAQEEEAYKWSTEDL